MQHFSSLMSQNVDESEEYELLNAEENPKRDATKQANPNPNKPNVKSRQRQPQQQQQSIILEDHANLVEHANTDIEWSIDEDRRRLTKLLAGSNEPASSISSRLAAKRASAFSTGLPAGDDAAAPVVVVFPNSATNLNCSDSNPLAKSNLKQSKSSQQISNTNNTNNANMNININTSSTKSSHHKSSDNKKPKFLKKHRYHLDARLSRSENVFHQPHEVFVELAELRLIEDVNSKNTSNVNLSKESGQLYEWREVSRWIKYEQNIDLETDMWSKPFVGALVYQSLLYLKTGLQYGTVLLNSDHETFADVIDEMVRDFIDSGHMNKEHREHVKRTLLIQHRHSGQQQQQQFAFSNNSSNNTSTGIGMRKKSTISDFFPYGRRQSTFTSSIVDHQTSCSANASRKNSSVQCSDYNINSKNNKPTDKWSSEVNLDNQKGSAGVIGSTGRVDSTVKFSGETKTANNETNCCSSSNEFQSSNNPASSKRRRSTIALLKNTITQSKLNRSDLNIKGLASDAEAFVAMVGVVDFLDRPVMGFVRLKNSQFIDDFCEVQIKVRFMFVLLGPKNENIDYLEIGRCMGTLMTNTEFRDSAYHAHDRRELIETITNFTNRSLCVVLPIGQFDDDLLAPVVDWMRNKLNKKLVKLNNNAKSSPSSKSKHFNHQISNETSNENNNENDNFNFPVDHEKKSSLNLNINNNVNGQRKDSFQYDQTKRKKSIFIYKSNPNNINANNIINNNNNNNNNSSSNNLCNDVGISSAADDYDDLFDPFQRTGYLFGCLIKEVKYRYSRYLSDFSDALNIHCLIALIFVFTVCLAPALSFGGILADKTDRWFGINEMLMATSLNGIIAGLLSGQPLMIFGPTGPFLVFEEMIYNYMKESGIDFLVMRCWVAFWVLIYTLIMLAFEGIYIIKNVTRFTEEIFAFLIATVFLSDAFKKIYTIFILDPMLTTEEYCSINSYCKNRTSSNSSSSSSSSSSSFFYLTFSHNYTCKTSNDELNEYGPTPNKALLSLILMVGTCTVALVLKKLRRSRFFGAYARRTLSDVGILISILFMVGVDNLIERETGVRTQKLIIPNEIWRPTKQSRPWFISPLGTDAKRLAVWVPFLASVPAMLVFIVLFFEVELTQMILFGKNRQLKKGTGFSSDLLISALMMNFNSLFGLPWTCAAPVRTLAHWASLTVYSKTYVPGEKAKLIEVKEQRLTNICVHLAIGLCLFFGQFLQRIPIAVLFGIFLYFGLVSSSGTQLFERIKLLFIPSKYCPSVVYARGVRPSKRNFFTLIQIFFILILLIMKSFEHTSYYFPIILVLLVPLRIFGLPKLFTNKELEQLDHHNDCEENNMMTYDFYELTHLPI